MSAMSAQTQDDLRKCSDLEDSESSDGSDVECSESESSSYEPNILSFENDQFIVTKFNSIYRIQRLLLIFGFFIISFLTVLFFILNQAQFELKQPENIEISPKLRRYYYQSVTKNGDVNLKPIFGSSRAFKIFGVPANSEFQHFYEYNGTVYALHYLKKKYSTYLTYLNGGKTSMLKTEDLVISKNFLQF